MKKQFFAVLLLGAAILVGCDPKNTPSGGDGKLTAISVSPKTVVLNENDPSIRLACTLTPKDAKADVAWSSSDTTVAIVSKNGYVEAQGYGACYIYATAGEFKDSCYVEVKTYLESLLFNGAIVWSEDTTYALDTVTGKYRVDTIQSLDGDVYYAYKALALLYVFSDGMYVNNSGYLDGTEVGTILKIEAPMYYATKYLNNSDRGTIFCLGEWGVVDDPIYMKQSAPATIDETAYWENAEGFVAAYNEGDASSAYTVFLKAVGQAVGKPNLTIYTYNAEDPENAGYYSSWVPDAICTKANLYLNGNFPTSQYMCGMDYSDIYFTPFAGDWGMALNYDAEADQLSFEDKKIHFDEPIHSVYGEVPAESKAMQPIHARIITEEPEVAARLENQLKKLNVVDFRKKF